MAVDDEAEAAGVAAGTPAIAPRVTHTSGGSMISKTTKAVSLFVGLLALPLLLPLRVSDGLIPGITEVNVHRPPWITRVWIVSLAPIRCT